MWVDRHQVPRFDVAHAAIVERDPVTSMTIFGFEATAMPGTSDMCPNDAYDLKPGNRWLVSVGWKVSDRATDTLLTGFRSGRSGENGSTAS